MSGCLFCYKPVEGGLDYHQRCSVKFFGIKNVPELNLDKELLDKLASQTVNKRIALTGVQPKLSLTLEKVKGEERLTIVGLWGEYILKPSHEQYQLMPETEDATMHLADLFKIKTCGHALIRTTNGSLAYIAKRFDRSKGTKIHVEDFCQLSEFLTGQKYKGSYEKCGKIIQQYCTNTGLDALNFFELVLFSFFTGNNDMHLKNFSLIHENNAVKLSPAYDLLNINLIFPADTEETALTLNGRKRKIELTDFESLANSLQLVPRAVENLFRNFFNSREKVLNLIESSFLPVDAQIAYITIWDRKVKQLNG